jgi:mono/diheme cytochrome c family protein
MQYPVLQNLFAGGGLIIALIAVVHVYVAQFAVGGGLYLVLTEHLARRRNSEALLEHVRRHTLFFLLLTMVFGSLTGVAIWFIIAVLSPGATLTLIHNFAFGWATEWVFFVGEIVTLLVYYYTFRKMEPRTHLTIGWLYFAFGWLSLFIIAGIIGLMLTPGEWLRTGDFWDGFFNPSFWPQVVFRTLVACGVAGLFAFFTAAREKELALSDTVARLSAAWTVLPLLLLYPAGRWYLAALPGPQRAMVAGGNPEIAPYVEAILGLLPVLIAGGLLMAVRMPRPIRALLAGALLLLGLVHFGSFEFIRESSRRPYVIYGHTYSNGVTVAEAKALGEGSYLAAAKWVMNKEITPENRLDAGRELFMSQCLSCHSVGGPMHDILPLTAHIPFIGMDAQLNGQGKLRPYMPRFLGTPEERGALASFIVEVLHGKTSIAAEQFTPKPTPTTAPAFDSASAEYTLLAWNTLGMHCISDSDPWFVILPPANDLNAQLIRRGPAPEVVTSGVTITYAVEPGFEAPADRVRFWEFAKSNFGKDLPANVGLAGKGMRGEMEYNDTLGAFEANAIPVTSYPGQSGFNPYPLFTVEARDTATGKLLASTRVVAPTSTEMGCKNCHGGGWREDGVAGFTKATSRDILRVHDRINHTDLLAKADAGHPAICGSCHQDIALGAKGDGKSLNLPAALHGWHANYLTGRGAEACSYCHPNNPQGVTRCLRGVHDDRGLDCTDCHGTMEDHSLALLKGELDKGKAQAAPLMANLTPRQAEDVAQVNGRTPWLGEPDCLNCHAGFAPPQNAQAFNTWTKGPGDLYRIRTDGTGLLHCPACHSSPHAVYPAREDSGYGKNRDNIQPMQYQGIPNQIGKNGNCKVCHGEDFDLPPSAALHHPMGLRQ